MATDAVTARGLSEPRAGWPTWARSLWHNWFVYSKTWRSSLTTSFLQPVMYLAAMGLGIGSLVDHHSGGVDGVSYLAFVAPGLLAASMLQMGVADCSYPVMGGLKWERTYWAKVATPLSVGDVVMGHLGWEVVRFASVSVLFLAVMAAFGVVASPLALLVVPVAIPDRTATAAPTAAFSATQDSDFGMALLFRLGVLPMFLFSGVFYPVTRLPQWAQALAEIVPLTHGVDVCRALTLGKGLGWGLLVDLAYLIVWSVVGVVLSLRTFGRRLVE
jgi:lipooligosaccharide transport system permease protein